MAHSAVFPPRAPGRPEPARIAAISAAILGNLAIFALLMRPVDVPTPPASSSHAIPVRIVQTPPIPPTPPVVKVRQDLPPAPTVKPMRLAPVAPPAIATHAQTTPMATTVVATTTTSTTIDAGADVAPPTPVETALVPIASPAPIYPRQSLAEGSSGTVILELLVDTDGRVLQARIVRSSGDRRLDAAARDTIVRGWRFTPALRNGKPIQALGQVPVVFRLDDAQ